MLNLFPLTLLLIALWQIDIAKGKGVIHKDYLSRENSIAIKGLLALVILFHHLSQATMEAGAPLFLLFAHAGGILPVALFFFYSGYGLQKKYMSSAHYEAHFLLKRVPSVLIPYLIVTGLAWLQAGLLGNPLRFHEVIRGFYNGYPIVRFSWFVLELLIFYFVFYLLMVLCKQHYGAMVMGAILYNILWVLICRWALVPPYWYRYSHLLILGMLWAFKEEAILKAIHKNGWPGIFTMCAIFLIAAPISHFGSRDFNEILLVLFIFAVLPAFTKIRFYNPILKFLGSISYEIYITQGLVITSLRNDRFYLQNDFYFCLGTLILTLLLSYLFHILFQTILKKYYTLLSRAISS